jgi:hypothetical protein
MSEKSEWLKVGNAYAATSNQMSEKSEWLKVGNAYAIGRCPPLPEAEPMSANLVFCLTTSCPDPATWATLWGPDALWWGAGSGGTSASVNLSVSPSGLSAFVLNLAFGHSEFWWAPGFWETGSLAEAAHATVSGIHLECTYADGSFRIKWPRHSSSSSEGAWGTASASGIGATFAIWHTSGLSNMVGAQFRDFA